MVDRQLSLELYEYIKKYIAKESGLVTAEEITYYLMSKIIEKHLTNIIKITSDLLEKDGMRVIRKQSYIRKGDQG